MNLADLTKIKRRRLIKRVSIVVGFAFLAGGSFLLTTLTDYIVGISLNLISSFLIYFASKTDSNITERVPILNFSKFSEDLADAKHTVRIMDIWLFRILDATNERHFKSALEKACRNKKLTIQIIITDPSAKSAIGRAIELSKGKSLAGQSAEDISQKMSMHASYLLQAIKHIHGRMITIEELTPESMAKLEIRFSERAPDIGLYQVDNKVRWNFYPETELAWDGDIYLFQTERGDNLSDLLNYLFISFWDSGEHVDFHDFNHKFPKIML